MENCELREKISVSYEEKSSFTVNFFIKNFHEFTISN